MKSPRFLAPGCGGFALVRFAAALVASFPVWADDALRNWFDDPFFQITVAVPDCPLPAGPFIDESEKRFQAHHRAERGTTCWLTKECDRKNSYAYDADIASALKDALNERKPFAGTSLWVTVQGRIVYIEGCVAQEAQAAEIEAFVRGVPYVQQAIAIVRSNPSRRVPYRLRVPP